MIKRHGIVLLFDDATAAKAIGLSEQTRDKAEDPDFVLGRETNIPHLTLFQLLIDDGADLEALVSGPVVGAVQEVLWPERRPGKGPLRLTGRFTVVKALHAFLFLRTKRFPLLDDLHRAVVEDCAPFRKGDIVPSWTIQSDQVENIRRYGYAAVAGRFDPHITLRRVKPEFAGAVEFPVSHPWTATHIAIGEMGEHGVLTDLRYRIPLT